LRKGTLTELGLYLARKSINKSDVARKTGLSVFRLSQLTINPKTQLKVTELVLIAKAIEIAPQEILNVLASTITLPEPVAKKQ